MNRAAHRARGGPRDVAGMIRAAAALIPEWYQRYRQAARLARTLRPVRIVWWEAHLWGAAALALIVMAAVATSTGMSSTTIVPWWLAAGSAALSCAVVSYRVHQMVREAASRSRAGDPVLAIVGPPQPPAVTPAVRASVDALVRTTLLTPQRPGVRPQADDPASASGVLRMPE